MAEDHFGEHVAERFDARYAHLADPAVVDPIVAFLADLATSASTSTTLSGRGLVSHHYWIDDGKVDAVSVPFRYVWPSELDLMARLAGMTLRERWAGWGREPFTGDSPKHVSVWEKSAVRAAATRRS
jgi:hypothetical protein